MDVLEAIKKRRSVGKMTDRMPDRAQIEAILEAGTHAPNHHEVQPWRFYVLAGESRRELGKVMAESLAARMAETTSEKAQGALQKELNKPLRSPVLIIVASEKPAQPKVVDIENVEAVSAAVQNMLLVAHDLGLASIWRTGDPAYDPAVKAFLGMDPAEHIVAFLYLGYPAIPVDQREPVHFSKKTSWLGWPE